MNSKIFFSLFGKSLYHIDAAYNKIAKRENVSPTLLWIMYAINDDGYHTQREICEDWDLPKSTVNTIIISLKDEGYLDLIPIKGKKREMQISLTESGKEYANKITKDVYNLEAKIYSKLSFEKNNFLDNLKEIEVLLKEETK